MAKEIKPWGYFHDLDDGEGYKVKRLHVNPGARLSLQRHEHREEFWFVLEGQGAVQCRDREFLLRAGETFTIPRQAAHRLKNTGKDSLVVLEVQRGKILSEDDIERLEDDYGRVGVAA